MPAHTPHFCRASAHRNILLDLFNCTSQNEITRSPGLLENFDWLHVDVTTSAWTSTNSEAQIGEGAVARRLAAGRCAVFVVPFSFVTFLLGMQKKSKSQIGRISSLCFFYYLLLVI